MGTVLGRIFDGRKLWPGLILIVVAILVLFPGSVFQGKTIAPGDLQFLYHPWRTEFTQDITGPGNWILFDEILEFYPWRQFLADNLRDGRVPLWDTTAFCGYPFQGLFQTAFLYPPDRLTDTLPYNFYTLFRAAFHIILAGLGMGLYLKYRKMDTSAITFGMCAYAICGFMIVWIGHPHSKVAAWLPWLFLGVDLLWKKHKHAFPILLTAMAMTILAGHIETALHTLSVAAAYFLLTFFNQKPTKSKKRVIVTVLAILILSVLLSGAMILPFTEYLSRSVAYATRADGVITQGWLDPILSLTILIPDLFGNSARNTYWYPGFNSAEIGGAFIGSITLVLALAAIATSLRKKLVIHHSVIALLSGFIAFGIPPVYQLVTRLPGYRMSYNFRMVLPMVFSMAVLGAFTINNIAKKKHRTALGIASIGSIIVCTIGVFLVHTHFQQSIITNPWKNLLETSLLIISGCILIPYLTHKISRHASYLFAVLLLIELLHNGYGFNPETSLKKLETLPASAKYLAVTASDEPFRSLPLGKTYPPHTSLRFGMHDIRGNDALTPLITEDYIALIEPDMRNKYNLPALRMMWMNSWQSPLLDALNVKYFVFPADIDQIPSGLTPFRTVGGVHLFLNPDCYDRAFLVSNWEYMNTDEAVLQKLLRSDNNLKNTAYLSGNGKTHSSHGDSASSNVTMLSYTSHKILLETQSESEQMLVLSDTFYPGWKVTIDEKSAECLRVNHMMRGIILQPGKHLVKFVFLPFSWQLGLFMTLLGCMLIPVFGVLLDWRK
ncbi:YfhO family protein [bacterium]|nr:YfhO family protein [bacterium]